jgi:UDP-N-acetylmuramyl tripeptide synthase
MIEISDRRKAIKYAIKNLLANDILIIAGKGHEKKQIIKSKSLPFDDVKISKRYI